MTRTVCCDVVITGGGPAGTAAYIAARRCGKRALLIEKLGFQGGQPASANLPVLCGYFAHGDMPRQASFGIAGELLTIFKKLGAYKAPALTPTGNFVVPVTPELVKYGFDRLTGEYADGIMLGTALAAADTKDGTITSVTCLDGEGLFTVKADMYVDASGNGMLGFLAGACTRFGGNDGTAQAATRPFIIGGIDPAVSVTDEMLEYAVRCAETAGMGPFSRKKGTLPRWIYADTGVCSMPTVMPEALDSAHMTVYERETRRQAYEYIKAFRRYVPGMENCHLISTGTALGLRETRHITGEISLSASDVLGGTKRPDSIGKGCWPVEIHSSTTVPGGFTYPVGDGVYDIPLGLLHSVNIRNLWAAGRCVSSDDSAFASLRVAATAMVTGQAAGVAAALGVTDTVSGIADVRAELLKQGAYI